MLCVDRAVLLRMAGLLLWLFQGHLRPNVLLRSTLLCLYWDIGRCRRCLGGVLLFQLLAKIPLYAIITGRRTLSGSANLDVVSPTRGNSGERGVIWEAYAGRASGLKALLYAILGAQCVEERIGIEDVCPLVSRRQKAELPRWLTPFKDSYHARAQPRCNRALSDITMRELLCLLFARIMFKV